MRDFLARQPPGKAGGFHRSSQVHVIQDPMTRGIFMRDLAYRNMPVALALHRCKLALLILTAEITCLSWLAPNLNAENWPQWRGPRHNGICTETDLPVRWSATENVAWKLPLPGRAGSTPVVWDDRIYLTSAAEGKLLLLSVSTSGEELWRRQLDGEDRDVLGDEGNLASPSPATDGKHVWTLIGTGMLACFDADGERRWAVDLPQRYGKLEIKYSLTSTPLLHEGRLYLQLIHGDRDPETNEAVVVCLDALTGKEVWLHHRRSDAHEECEHSYASPTLFHDSNQTLLLTHGADYLVAHALEDGHELWRCGGINSPGNYHRTLRLVSSPVANENLIIIPTAKNGPVFGVRPGIDSSNNGIAGSTREVLWEYPDSTPDVPSPLVKDGLVYLCRENGNLICLEAQSGEEVYHKRTIRNRHRASPVWADGKLYLTCRNGTVTVIQAGREFEILEQNDLGEEIAASPAIAGGTIYLRTYESLFAIREK